MLFWFKTVSQWSQHLKDKDLVTARTSINFEIEIDRRSPTWLVLMVEFKEREASKHEALNEVLRGSHGLALVRSRSEQITVQFKTYYINTRTNFSARRGGGGGVKEVIFWVLFLLRIQQLCTFSKFEHSRKKKTWPTGSLETFEEVLKDPSWQKSIAMMLGFITTILQPPSTNEITIIWQTIWLAFTCTFQGKSTATNYIKIHKLFGKLW